MVRKGSSVRVRQRALTDRPHSQGVCDLVRGAGPAARRMEALSKPAWLGYPAAMRSHDLWICPVVTAERAVLEMAFWSLRGPTPVREVVGEIGVPLWLEGDPRASDRDRNDDRERRDQ